MLERFEEKFITEPNTGCWLWTHSETSTEYGQFSVNNKPKAAHRVSYELYIGPIPKGLWVLHKCDTPLCVNPSHLFLGTHQDNDRDREVKGRGRNGGNLHITIGEKHGGHKLTETDIKNIRAIYRSGSIINGLGASNFLAKKYNVRRQTIWRIVTNQSWRHIK